MASSSPRGVDLLVSGAYVLTLDDHDTVHYPGSIAIAGGRIVAVGRSCEIDPRYVPAQRIDAQDRAVLPGLVNCHGHASNSLIRGLGGDLSLDDWLRQVCWPYMAKATEEDLYNGVLLSCVEMLLNGITTFADMWVGVGASAEAVAISGQRAILAHNIKEFDDPERGRRELAAALDARSRWHGLGDGRISVGLGPHSVYTCSPGLLREIAAIAREEAIHLQIHGSETKQEVSRCLSIHGVTPIRMMANEGILGNRTVVAHAVHLDEKDVDLLASSGSAVAHNVCSNLKLASGIAPIQRYLRRGIPVGIGTDGPASNDGLDLLRDLKCAVLVQNVFTGDPASIPATQGLRMATRLGARALGMADQVGTLESGKQADLVLLRLDQPHFTPLHYADPASVASLLVTCASGADVDTVIVAGKVLVRSRQCLHLDVEAIRLAAQRSSDRLAQ